MNALRGVFNQADALARIDVNLQRRYQTIVNDIAVNTQNASRGLTVAGGLREFRTLASAIGQHVRSYGRNLPGNGRSLIDILFKMLLYMTERDEDVYANARAPRAQYAGGGNTGNIFREFVREHMWIIELVQRLPAPVLRLNQNTIRVVIERVRSYGPLNGDRAQFQQLVNVLSQVWREYYRFVSCSERARPC